MRAYIFFKDGIRVYNRHDAWVQEPGRLLPATEPFLQESAILSITDGIRDNYLPLPKLIAVLCTQSAGKSTHCK